MSSKIILELPETIHKSLISHLLPNDCKLEQAAFVFAKHIKVGSDLTFRFVDWQKLIKKDFVYQHKDYLELNNDVRASLIKKAHDLDSSLVEFHSHPSSKYSIFSVSDMFGFKEFVPHVYWRLKGKPYLAAVVTSNGFDAIAWLQKPFIPQGVHGINVGSRILRPSGLTLQYLEAPYARTI